MKARDERPVPASCYSNEYFLEECEGFAEFRDTGGRVLPERLRLALRLCDAGRGMRVLDVGCGRGEVLMHCAAAGALACGIDFSPDALSLTASLIKDLPPAVASRISILRADAKALPFGGATFDRVLMLDLVEHLHAWEFGEVLGEVKRVLSPGGSVIIHTMPNRWYYVFGYPLYRGLQRLRGKKLPANPRERWKFVQHVHVNEQDVLGLARMLRKAGFSAKVWLQSMDRYADESPFVSTVAKVLSRVFPFKLIFCNDIYAVARVRGVEP